MAGIAEHVWLVCSIHLQEINWRPNIVLLFGQPKAQKMLRYICCFCRNGWEWIWTTASNNFLFISWSSSVTFSTEKFWISHVGSLPVLSVCFCRGKLKDILARWMICLLPGIAWNATQTTPVRSSLKVCFFPRPTVNFKWRLTFNGWR